MAAHPGAGPVLTDHRYRAVLEKRAEEAKDTARGIAPWSRDSGLDHGPLTLPELVLGALLTLEVVTVPLGPVVMPASELGTVALLALAACRRSRRDASALGAAGLVAALLLIFLAAVSMSQGIADAEWLRRLARIAAMVLLIGCIAGGRLDLRSVFVGMVGAVAVNVPLFYLGVVPAPYGGYLTGVLGDKNVAGLYYAILAFLALPMVRKRRTRTLLLIGAAACVLLTGSRTSMAAMFCGLVWLVITPRLGSAGRLGVIAMLAGGVAFAEENLARVGVFGNREGTDWLRGEIQRATAAKVTGTPWHGRGLTEAHVDIGQATWLYHQSYAGLYTEGGVVLFGCVLAAYAFFGLRLMSRRLRTPSRVALEAAAVVILVTATQLGEVFISIPSMLVLGVGTSLYLQERDEPLEQQVLDRRREEIIARARARGV